VGAFPYGPVHGFMVWNLFLATVPAILALALFTTSARRGVVWGLGLSAWILFLLNAPYLLTDVVHMVHEIRVAPSDARAYVVIATYGGLFAFGLAVYALSLQLFRRFLHRTVRARLVASDGGVFDFSDTAFVGSVGSQPPAIPIVGVGATA
jgi:uncharacterized membrane protein